MKEQLQNIAEEIEQLASSKIEQTRLKTVEKSINILSGSLTGIILAIIGLLTLMVITLVSILLLNNLLDSLLNASLIVMVTYIIILTLLIIFKKKILTNPIKNSMMGEYLETYKINKHE